jgi:amino acid transporter
VTIVLFVILVGAFEVDVSNWTPFAPNGFKTIVTGATVVFFAYVGFDAVANSAEETKKPQVICCFLQKLVLIFFSCFSRECQLCEICH